MSERELRELDAWIAEHVMGYKRRNDETCLPWDDGGMLSGVKWCGLSMIQRYTTDPAAAFAVLEKCKDVCIQYGLILNQWTVGTLSSEVHATAKTLPLAICLFAQKLFSENQTQ